MAKKRNPYKAYAIVSTFVFEVILVVGGFVLLGYFLSKWTNAIVFLILFSVLGVFAGIYNLIRKVNKVE